MSVIGLEGLPSDLNAAGNVVYKGLKIRCSMRVPPRMKAAEVGEKIK